MSDYRIDEVLRDRAKSILKHEQAGYPISNYREVTNILLKEIGSLLKTLKEVGRVNTFQVACLGYPEFLGNGGYVLRISWIESRKPCVCRNMIVRYDGTVGRSDLLIDPATFTFENRQEEVTDEGKSIKGVLF